MDLGLQYKMGGDYVSPPAKVSIPEALEASFCYGRIAPGTGPPCGIAHHDGSGTPPGK